MADGRAPRARRSPRLRPSAAQERHVPRPRRGRSGSSRPPPPSRARARRGGRAARSPRASAARRARGVKGSTATRSMPRRARALRLLVEGHERGGGALRGEDARGMRIEGEHHRRAARWPARPPRPPRPGPGARGARRRSCRPRHGAGAASERGSRRARRRTRSKRDGPALEGQRPLDRGAATFLPASSTPLSRYPFAVSA